MKKELTIQGKTTESAVAEACAKLGVDIADVTFEVLEEAKKGFLGMGATPARVRVEYVQKPVELAAELLKKLLDDMEIDAEITVTEGTDGEKRINITGESAGVLIGHHGDTLDSLQYLACLAANRRENEDDEREYTRIILDIENYRAKREETLRTLAGRTAQKVLKYKRNVTLEPMSAQERRIIHATVQGIEGVTTFSVGQDSARKVVISLDRKSST